MLKPVAMIHEGCLCTIGETLSSGDGYMLFVFHAWGTEGSQEPSEHTVYILCAKTALRGKKDNNHFQPLFTLFL